MVLSEVGRLAYNHPAVDVDVGVCPAVSFVDEEHEIIFVLSVKIFLLGHRVFIASAHEQGILDKWNVYDFFAGWIIDFDAHVVAAVGHQA